MLFDLFIAFFKIGLISFGGGYAMIPIIEYEVHHHGWLTTQQFTDVVAIAGMAPGPIATNCAVFVGYKLAGILGAIISAVSVSLPSLLLIVLVAHWFKKVQHHPYVQSTFYGLRPVITGLILYAAVRFAIQNQIIGQGYDIAGILILILALLCLLFTKIHPIGVIALSGIIGIFVYY